MNLTLSKSELGLWVNDDWSEGDPGLFAVVIGVSSYAHLDEGTDPAKTTYGLGQLEVSALTAYSVFKWLRDRYDIDDCPIAKCWMLLSPTSDELQHTPELAENLLLPTFDNCSHALKHWYGYMDAQPKVAGANSRSFFFFSGHGLEVHQEEQVLLPSDYLRPPAPNPNTAISAQNLQGSLGSLDIGHQFFFFDACRNDDKELRGKVMEGTKILPEDEAALVSESILSSTVLYATASGQQAFQQPDPKSGISIFGRALLDGLVGTPKIKLESRKNRTAVTLFPLQGYIKGRVVELLNAEDKTLKMPVRFAGRHVEDVDVTLLAGETSKIATPPEPPQPVTPLIPSMDGTPGNTPYKVPLASDSTLRFEQAMSKSFAQNYSVTRALIPEQGLPAVSLDHDVWGSENVTEVWQSRFGLYSLQTQGWIKPDQLIVHSVDRDPHTQSYVLEVSIDLKGVPNEKGHWLELTDTTNATLGCVLPADRSNEQHGPHYILEFDVEFSPPERAGRPFARLEAYLSPRGGPPLQNMAALFWQRYRNADFGEAVSTVLGSGLTREIGDVSKNFNEKVADGVSTDDIDHLTNMVREKLRSPLAATVASIILLRANRFDVTHDWMRNLAIWFPERPDGPVLWAEQVFRKEKDRDKAITEAASYLVMLTDRGLPQTSECFAYAVSLTERLLRLDRVPSDLGRRLKELNEQLTQALVTFRPGGLFTAFAGFEAKADPAVLLGLVRSAFAHA